MLGKVLAIMKKKDRLLYLRHAVHESLSFGILLAIVGGFLDAYTFIARGGVFANAQTGNIILVAVYAAQAKWGQALAALPPILAFVIGVIVVEAIKSHSAAFFTLDWKRAIIILEIIVLIIVGFIPQTIPNIIINVTISFVASVQVSSFRKLVDASYCTTMTTGNLRTAAEAAYIAVTRKDYKSTLRAIRFFAIIFSFFGGGFLGGLLTSIIGVKAIWVAAFILIVSLILFMVYERDMATSFPYKT